MVTFDIQAKPLPSNFRGTPNQLLRAFLDRIEVIDDKHTFVMSDTQPATNAGPWFKSGKQLWVWNGTTYIPLDISESAQAQIHIGAAAPEDPGFLYWFQVDGQTVTGLKYYLNSVWTGVDSTIAPGSVTTVKLADGAATTEKFVDGSVTSIKIQAPLLLSKWQGGAANQFAKMNAAGTEPTWEGGRLVSPIYDFAASSQIEFLHGLGEMPHRVECYLSSIITQGVWLGGPVSIPANTPIHIRSFPRQRAGKTPLAAYLKTVADLYITYGYITEHLFNVSDWRVQFYVTPK